MSTPGFSRATRQVTERGIRIPVEDNAFDVFISENTLIALAEQSRWDTHFGNPPILLTPAEGKALVQVGLAEQETRGGYHGTDLLRSRMDEWEWM